MRVLRNPFPADRCPDRRRLILTLVSISLTVPFTLAYYMTGAASAVSVPPYLPFLPFHLGEFWVIYLLSIIALVQGTLVVDSRRLSRDICGWPDYLVFESDGVSLVFTGSNSDAAGSDWVRDFFQSTLGNRKGRLTSLVLRAVHRVYPPVPDQSGRHASVRFADFAHLIEPQNERSPALPRVCLRDGTVLCLTSNAYAPIKEAYFAWRSVHPGNPLPKHTFLARVHLWIRCTKEWVRIIDCPLS